MQQKLTKSERILLIACLQIQDNQRRILKALGEPTEGLPESSDAIEILSRGAEHFYENALGCLNARLSEEADITTAESSQILDVLDMYRGIGDYIGKNPKDGEVCKHHAARFRGFDGNNESRQQWFVHFAVSRRGLYSELKPKGKESRDFNSHWPMSAEYGRMVKVWRQAKRPTKLTREEVLAILKAADEAT